MRFIFPTLLMLSLGACRSLPPVAPVRAPLVLMTDFGVRDGAVAAMKGVATGVSSDLIVTDLTHEIPPFDIWTASLRLQQTYSFWPAGTVFVTVVDPGVGSARRSLVVRTKSGHVFVGPDNGYLSLVLDDAGVASVRILNESLMRRAGSEHSYTFHGRDLYAYVGAQLAAGRLKFENSGAETSVAPLRLAYQSAVVTNGMVQGLVPTHDPNYGNVWTNIPKAMIESTFPGARELRVYVAHQGRKVFEGKLPLVTTFGTVGKGQPLVYFNSLLNLALALNQGDFAKTHHLGYGPEWTITISKP